MPFTLAHPAAAVPLARRGLVFSALVVGSMTPDVVYFLPPLHELHDLSHSIWGVVSFCVPVGLVALCIFHWILKFPLLSLLPASHQQRLIPVARRFSLRPAPRFLLVLVSLALGAFTHVLWDSFTHKEGWAVRAFPILASPIPHTPVGNLPNYKFLQHLSTLFGLLLLCYWYVKWLRQAPKEHTQLRVWPRGMARWSVTVLIASIAFVSSGIQGLFSISLTDLHALQSLAGDVSVRGLTILFVELFAYSLIWYSVNPS